jgi:excinuclease ABC subunit C
MLLQQIRDEAHRFAITFHRQKRSKTQLTTELEGLEGIGKKTTERLLQHFKSLKKIKEAPIEEIAKIVGQKKAEIIKPPGNPPPVTSSETA